MTQQRPERRDAIARLLKQLPARRKSAQKAIADSQGLPLRDLQDQYDEDVFKTVARERGLTPMDLEMRLLASNEAQLKQMQRTRIESHAKAARTEPANYFAFHEIDPAKDFGQAFTGMI